MNPERDPIAERAQLERLMSGTIGAVMKDVMPHLPIPTMVDTTNALVTFGAMAMSFLDVIDNVREALGTSETSFDAIVEIARNAHAAEQRLAALERKIEEAL